LVSLAAHSQLLNQAAALTDPVKAATLTRQATIWRFDAFVAVFFLVLVLLIVLGSAKQWWQLLRGTKRVVLHESEFVPLSAVSRPLSV